jgi:hypothetical protein
MLTTRQTQVSGCLKGHSEKLAAVCVHDDSMLAPVLLPPRLEQVSSAQGGLLPDIGSLATDLRVVSSRDGVNAGDAFS